MKTCSQTLSDLASYMDREYEKLVQDDRRFHKPSTRASHVTSGRLQEMAWWAAHLRTCALRAQDEENSTYVGVP